MSASFFGFDTSGPPMEGEDTEEGDMTIEDVEGYDALNEDTFGCGATNDNWEATHEKFTQELHSFEEEGKANTTADSGFHTSDRSKTQEDDFMEQSITHLVLDDDDIDDPAIMMSSKSRPIATAHSPPSSLNRSLFSPSPPTLLDPTNLISPTQRSIWSSQRVPSPDEKLKSLLHIGEITLPPTLVDTAIVSAVHERSPSPPCFPQAITVEQLENLSPRTTPSRPIPMSSAMERDFASRVLPPRSVSPIIGSPPSTALPIGTPPKHYQYMTQQQMHHNTGPIPPHILHHMHQQIMRSGGRLSPTQLNQMIQEGRASPAAMTPPSMRLSLMSPRIPPPPHGALLPRGQVPSHMRSPGMRGGSSPPVGSNSPSQYRKGNDNPHYQRQQQYNQRQFYNHDRYHYVKNNNRQMYSDDRQRFPDSTNGVYDEYANLMTPKEKDWIIKIQMMQLQSNNPYLDDYYYQTFVLRKRAEVKKLNNEGIQTVKKDEPKIIMPPAKQSDARQYKPAHFEGTLGTVSVASVNNPRKMIDVKRAPSLQDDDLITSQPLKKRAVVLLSIEKVYSLLLELEDLEKKALALPDDESVNEERDDLTSQMYTTLKVPDTEQTCSDNRFLQVLSVSKGRKLISRVLPVLSTKQAMCFVQNIFYNISFLIKKDSQDSSLHLAFPSVAAVIKLSDLEMLVVYMKCLTSGSSVASLGSTPVSAAVQNKFGICVLCCLLSKAEDILSTTLPIDIDLDTEKQWNDYIVQIGGEIASVNVENMESPTEDNCNQVLEHFARYVDKQTYITLQQRIKFSA